VRPAAGMPDPTIVDRLRRKFDLLLPLMIERMRRNWAAAEALEIGWGGVSAVVSATGLSHNTIDLGIRELEGGVSPDPLQSHPVVSLVREEVGSRSLNTTPRSCGTWNPSSIP
jgi:hypothetical protein